MRVLVVEDDPDVGDDLAHALLQNGLLVERATNGEDAWFLGSTEDYAVVVLDLGLPRLDGLSVLRRWRKEGRRFPILILTAHSDWTEKVEGIEAGADDYMVKPFAMGELIARVRALLRRAAGHGSPVLSFGRLTLDTKQMAAVVETRTIRLSPLEYRFLECLALHPAQVVPTHVIAEHLYGTSDRGEANAIEALITRLRRKLGNGIIETRRGLGYLLSEAPR